MGESLIGGKKAEPATSEGTATPLTQAVEMFLQHVRVHSPDKPRTARRYSAVMDHAERILGGRTFIEAITRADIDNYKARRSGERSAQHKNRPITPRTINYEIAVLRTFFYFFIRERNLPIGNPCANFKLLKDPPRQGKAPSSYLPSGRDRSHLRRMRRIRKNDLRDIESEWSSGGRALLSHVA